MPAAKGLSFAISEPQENSVAEISEKVSAFSCRQGRETCRSGLPTSMHWLGTSLLTNQVLCQLWPYASGDSWPAAYETHISNHTFAASVHFTHRRFLRGQAVFAVDVEERSWHKNPSGATD